MEPSDRDLARELERVDPAEDEVDDAKVWEAFLTATPPEEMDSKAEADAVRSCWLLKIDGIEPGELDEFSDSDIEKLDGIIRREDGA